MRTSIDSATLAGYLGRQLGHFFPDGKELDLSHVVERALERLEACFSRVVLRDYRESGQVTFNHLHSDQYATFLYFAANTTWRETGNVELASKLYCLNKALNGLMCSYDTELPAQFLIIHTVGMMLGKATYGDCFVAIHNATIGTDRGIRPRLGDKLVIHGGAAVLGDCTIGDNVTLAVRATVRNTTIPSGQVVAGISPNLVIKPATRMLIEQFFEPGG